jgi:hypothetical protein
MTGALTVHCVARRRRTCKKWNGTGEGICDHSWLSTLSVQSLVKLLIVGAEPRLRPVISYIGVTNVARQH